MTGRLLVVDDEANVRRAIRQFFEDLGHSVREAGSVAEARGELHGGGVDLVLLDVRMPREDGLTLLREAQAGAAVPGADVPLVLMMSGHATVELAVQATRMGAHDFLEKPPDPERWSLAVRNALEVLRLRRENARLRGAVPSPGLLGNSPSMRSLLAAIGKVGPTLGRVLIQGENGTGKELVAMALHAASPRAGGPFVKLNCAALPRDLVESELFGHEKGAFTGAAAAKPGRLELAQGGTLFLDEIGDLSAEAQAKFLRVLETGEFERVGGVKPMRSDARILSATNKDLPALVKKGEFREDLFFRLHVVPLQVPALRDRPGDVALLARHYLDVFAALHDRPRRDLESGAVELLEHHRWPGNVRELRNLMERLVILAEPGPLRAAEVERALPREDAPSGSDLRGALDGAEREALVRALAGSGWNVSEAAEALGIDRASLHRKIRKYGLRREAGSA
ncbi:MAG: sigma-54-dependent Fis family transcriptional regulator [Candidatus Eisenbacteria bacterium]|nr:sigma-54-dependent Fis family transcriptional regulator [Candidatus Eisenbacteria bacterium]